ncbi:hypothetical protein CR969_01130 [Candidatus Saccharibacteria bacterium]|nr:MAG: hypothetical protein CR969_01130 [Candidatus Saccharibacteria bacterium]
MRQSKSGFTVAELMIVIFVIAILATISITVYGKIQEKSYDSKVDLAIDQAVKLVTTYNEKNSPDRGPSLDTQHVHDEMKSQGYFNDDFIYQLKDFSPMYKQGLNSEHNFVRIHWCGERKYIVSAEAYSDGMSETDYYQELTNCSNENSAWNGSVGGISHTNTGKERHFRIKHLDFND